MSEENKKLNTEAEETEAEVKEEAENAGCGCESKEEAENAENAGCGCESKEEGEKCCSDKGSKGDGCGKKKCGGKKHSEELEKLQAELSELKKQRDDLQDKYLRVAAEYDNFRKRTSKEKEGIYSDAYADALKQIFPIIDNLERAAECEDGAGVAEGVKMTLSQCKASLEKLGVEPIACEVGAPFDPELHNAVMHTEDPELGESVIAAIFQRGYKRGDKVLRFSMVSVAN
ncbi:MAG: nucleotide exchange factor GrpE [Clostridia bacterium]|nr:nucleotide exchange factor GrpE [Clostridia bacterium]